VIYFLFLALASKNHNAIVFTTLPYVILNVPVPACANVVFSKKVRNPPIASFQYCP
ncbi:hypothetical protein L9F63_024407, partial [Diploptera punctata]